jgi:hypothetical protein
MAIFQTTVSSPYLRFAFAETMIFYFLNCKIKNLYLYCHNHFSIGVVDTHYLGKNFEVGMIVILI